MLLYGEPGTRKTSLTMHLPDSLFIDCEGGANLPQYVKALEEAGALYLGPEDGAGQFKSVLEELKEIAFVNESKRKNVVLDGFSKLFNNRVREEHSKLEDAGKDTDYGRDRKPALNETRKLLAVIDQLPCNVFFVCHQRPNYDGTAEPEPDCPRDIAYDLNLVLRTSIAGPSYYLHVVKSRYPQFTKGDRLECSYEAFMKQWRGEE